ncbi:UDP-N-acetylglucosamine pyrophosphorylase [bacterium DOLJORAL78_65_58]|nr:MAG: UDP-N-acetylglucosamine pyrophosphorylase [bacterium DOLZORAL124_64_63]PIE75726.1 MAG: UDP-N-acetylglucosamine pyrophosphorylase [bacterium DOLJORAL78_65_58]
MNQSIDAVVLAAGKGTRMKSDLPKVLHEIAGRPLLDHVLDTAEAAGIDHTVVVVGHKADLVEEKCGRQGLDFVLQEPQLGTGHAVQVAVPALRRGGFTVVLAGDVPLLTVATLRRLVAGTMAGNAAAAILTCVVPDAGAYGRIVKDGAGHVQKIVEFADASDQEKAIGEYNTGVICFRTDLMIEALAQLKTDNNQGEYYLTDTIGWFVANGHAVDAVSTTDPDEVVGINTVDQLAEAAALLEKRGG